MSKINVRRGFEANRADHRAEVAAGECQRRARLQHQSAHKAQKRSETEDGQDQGGHGEGLGKLIHVHL
jgi:hypothetical protein